MISYENKLKLISGDYVELFSGRQICASYECIPTRESGPLLNFSDKIYSDHSWICIYFAGIAELYITFPSCKVKFLRESFEELFWELSQSDQSEIFNYCDWIMSDDGRNFVKQISSLKLFL